MTASRVSRITRLECRPLTSKPKSFRFGLFDGMTLVVWAEHRREKMALALLLQNNWERVRLIALRRADFACERCGAFCGLHGHHMIHRSKERIDVESNIQVLCNKCHNEEHRVKKTLAPAGQSRVK